MKDKMQFYMAPMEGITGYIFRNAHKKYFGGMKKYFSPFLVAREKRQFHARELRDILPENNRKIRLIPQILANRSEDFLRALDILGYYGYKEVNLNLGCPSKTVVSKHRGAGFLEDPIRLDAFFEKIFTKTDMKISVKTRLGLEFPDEFEDILKIYNSYPIEELILHPRVQNDYYQGSPRKKYYGYALKSCSCPLCYNGDIFSKKDFNKLTEEYPDTSLIMLGRGILKNPDLALTLKGELPASVKILRQFHNEVCEGYREEMSGDIPVLFKMKEVWSYLIERFPGEKKFLKKIQKTQR